MRFAWIEEPPFNFRDGGRVTGCDVELARLATSRLGEDFVPIETTFAELLDGLEDDRWDVATGMFVTPRRAARASFTRPIWSLRDGLLVARRDAGAIDGYGSLARSGAKLAVLNEQVQIATALGLGIEQAQLVRFDRYEDAAAAVEDGSVAAYASVERAHLAHLAAHPEAGLACVPVPAREKAAEPGAFACRSQALRDRIDAALAHIIGGAEHVAMLASFGMADCGPPG